jgi:hypothetical protein
VAAGYTVFSPRSIHDPRAIDFLCNHLRAGSWHRQLLEKGLLFTWSGPPPPPYHEPNNKSALDNLDKLRETVDAWLIAGFVEPLTNRPYFCNPLTVAVQHNAAQCCH